MSLLSTLVLGAAFAGAAQDGAVRFAPPVMLTTDAGPLAHGMLYPSPAMYDLDGDGKLELIVADLFGNVQFAKRTDGPDTQWSALSPVLTRDLAPLKFSNW